MLGKIVTGAMEAEGRFGYKPFAMIMSKALYMELALTHNWFDAVSFIGIQIITSANLHTSSIEFVGKPQHLLSYTITL